jgi:hypothetical protein
VIGSSLMEHSVIQELVRNGDSEPGGVGLDSFWLAHRKRGAGARPGWRPGRAGIRGSARSGPPSGRGALFGCRRRSAKAGGRDGTPDDLSGPTDANRLIVGPTMNLPDNLSRLHVDELPIKAASPG